MTDAPVKREEAPNRAICATPLQRIGFVLGIVAFLSLTFLDSPLQHYGAFEDRPAAAAGITALMAIWWLTEAVPIHWTACVPLLAYPFLHVFEGGFATKLRATALPYIDPYIFLFMGGMCVAAAMQQCNLHRRIALNIMKAIGTDPRHLLLGVLIGTAFISLWISNTATAAMMLPIGLAIIKQSEAHSGGKRLVHYGAAIMLGIAYAANVGGIGTKIGTVPNSQFSQFMADKVGVEISFFQFALVGVPFVILFLPIVWFALWRVGRADAPPAEAGRLAVATELGKLGSMKPAERVVLRIFLVVIAVWMCGKPLTDLLRPHVTAFALKTSHVEGGSALIAAIVVLLWRVQGRRILEWPAFRAIPWSTLLLLGGSFSMAEAVQTSGLSNWLGNQLAALRDLPPLAQLLVACITTVGISAVASNVSTIAVMLTVLHSAIAPPLRNTVLFASTIASSCDFALPAGTPPNAIVFGSGYVTVGKMAKTGFLLDLIAAILCGLWCSISVDRVV